MINSYINFLIAMALGGAMGYNGLPILLIIYLGLKMVPTILKML